MIENLKKLGHQFREFWSGTTPSAKFGMIATLAISLLLIVLVGIWSAQPVYVPLTSDVKEGEYDNILRDLEKKNITYKTSESGMVISVDRSKLAAAKSVLSNYTTEASSESGASGWGVEAPDERRNRMQMALETQLEKTISGYQGVQSADVHLTIAKHRWVNPLPSKASVVLHLKPGFNPSMENIDAIASMVSHVKGLTKDNISVSDSRGNVYDVSSDRHRNYRGKMAFQKQTEAEHERKLENLLNSVVGFGKHSFTVKAEVNYIDRSIQKMERDGDGYIVETDEKTSRTTNPGNQAQGAPGVAANVTNPVNPNQPNNRPVVLTEDKKSSTVFDTTETKTTELYTDIKLLTVAAYVEIPEDDAGQPIKTKTEIEDLIKASIGFDELRGDIVTVEFGKIAENPFMSPLVAADAAPTGTNEFILNIIKQSSLGLGALFAFVIGILMLRKLNPVTIREQERQITPERSKHLADLSKIAGENPEFLARVIAGWINEKPADDLGGNKREEEASQTAA